MRAAIWLSILVCGCTGGGASKALNQMSPGSFDAPDDALLWASSVSAPQVYGASLAPLLIVELGDDDPDCPKVTEDGDDSVIEGDCIDSEGVAWMGRAESTQVSATVAEVRYEGFGYDATLDDCPGTNTSVRFDGKVVVTSDNDVDIDVVATLDGPDGDAGCEELSETLAWDYEARVEESGEVQRWNGTGRIGASSEGWVDATTVDEVLDPSVCSDEAISGTTTIEAGGHTGVVTYDGATDCDPEATVQWSYDGEDRGELEGISCSTAGAGAWFLGLALPLFWRRRRSPGG